MSVFSLAIIPSRNIILYLVLIHSVMLVTLLSLMAISWWSLLIIVTTLLSYTYFYKKTQLLINIERDADDNWSCHYQNGFAREKLRLTSSIVNPIFVMLNFKGNGIWRRPSVIIMADAVDIELFRQLRVFCRDPKTFHK